MMCLIASDSYLGGQELQKKPAVHCYHYISRVIIFIGFYRAMLCIRGTSHGPVSVCVCHKS